MLPILPIPRTLGRKTGVSPVLPGISPPSAACLESSPGWRFPICHLPFAICHSFPRLDPLPGQTRDGDGSSPRVAAVPAPFMESPRGLPTAHRDREPRRSGVSAERRQKLLRKWRPSAEPPLRGHPSSQGKCGRPPFHRIRTPALPFPRVPRVPRAKKNLKKLP
jgi:hypothetical protein